jgi:hypothetical protein
VPQQTRQLRLQAWRELLARVIGHDAKCCSHCITHSLEVP